MKRILPPSRPRRNEDKIKSILRAYGLDKTDKPVLVFVRGYYLDTMGVTGQDDRNIYDDAAFLYWPNGGAVESFNANTNPSFIKRNGRSLAQLNLGSYRFYKGLHKGKYSALRSYPEGVVLDCTREGKPSTCSHINIHKGSTKTEAEDVVWSEGRLTIPDTQYLDFITRVYDSMTKAMIKVIEVVLVENRATNNGQAIFDHNGRIIN